MKTKSPSTRTRRAAILIVALVAICVASALLGTLLLGAAAQRKRVDVRTWEAQAAWLVESGLDRAAARLATDPKYPGETWRINEEMLGGAHAAVVAIKVARDEQQPGRWTVHVQADYPDHPQHRVRKSKQVVMDRSEGETAS